MVWARRFLVNWQKDSDILTDSRMMVPLYYDILRKRIRVSVVCGYQSRDVTVKFGRTPEVCTTDFQGQRVNADVTWKNSSYTTVYPVQFECDVAKLLDRESLRAISNKYPDPNELRVVLENLT